MWSLTREGLLRSLASAGRSDAELSGEEKKLLRQWKRSLDVWNGTLFYKPKRRPILDCDWVQALLWAVHTRKETRVVDGKEYTVEMHSTDKQRHRDAILKDERNELVPEILVGVAGLVQQ